MNKSLKEKTTSGLIWGGISNTVQQLLGVIFGIYLARVLGAEDYGMIGMLTIFSVIAGAIINSGFSVALTNKIDPSQRDYDSVFWFTVLVGAVLYVVLFFTAPLIANFYHQPPLIPLSRLIFLSFFFSGIATVSHTVMFKHLMVKQQAVIDISAMAASGVVGVYLAHSGYGYWALAWQNFVYLSGRAILRLIFSPWKPSFQISMEPLKEMFPFSSKIMATTIFQQINNNIFSVILGKLYNVTQLGYYTQANKWTSMASQTIVGMLNSVAQPVMVAVGGDKQKQHDVFRRMMRFAAFVTLPSFAILSLVSREFIIITIGEKWIQSAVLMQILCGYGIFNSFFQLYTQLIIANGRSDIFLRGNIYTSICQLLVLLGLYLMGLSIIWLVVGFVLNYAFMLLYWHYHASKLIGVSLKAVAQDLYPYMIATIISIALAYATGLMAGDNIYLGIVYRISTAALCYIGIMKYIKCEFLTEIIDIIRKKRRKI